MPEGHTVHRLANMFDALFAGQQVRVSSPQGRFSAGAAQLDGHELVVGEAFGKQMFLGFRGGPYPANGGRGAGGTDDAGLLWLRVHLGLYGAWSFAGDGSRRVEHAIGAPRRRVGERETTSDTAPPPNAGEHFIPPEPRGQVRARILGRHAVADLTGPTACEVITTAERDVVIARLGPDPLRADADPGRFIDRVRRSRTAIGVQLMNQEVIAGVGNIYRAEVLFRAGLDPATPGPKVSADVLRAIWDDLVLLMRDGVRTGRIITTEPQDRGRGHERGLMDPRRVRQNSDGDQDAVAGNELFYVYHRDGLACRRCGNTVAVREVAARNLFWCPGCQK